MLRKDLDYFKRQHWSHRIIAKSEKFHTSELYTVSRVVGPGYVPVPSLHGVDPQEC